MKWFRFYSAALHDPKVQRLPPHLFKFWVNLLCAASESIPHRGTIPSVGELAWLLRLSDERTVIGVDELVARGFIDRRPDGALQIHNWEKWQFKADDVNARTRASMRRSRERSQAVHMNGARAEADTDTEQSRGQIAEAEAEAEGTTAAFRAYEDCIGSLSAYNAERIGDDVEEYGSTCVIHCLQEAAASNKRNLKYAEAIMGRHKTEGCYDRAGENEDDDRISAEEAERDVAWLAATRRRPI